MKSKDLLLNLIGIPVRALVVPADAPLSFRVAAWAAKAVYGNRVQVCDGVADDVEISAALAAAGNLETFCHPGTYNLGAQVKVRSNTGYRWQTLRFGEGSVILPSVDVELFKIGYNGRMYGGIIDTRGIAYTKRVFTINDYHGYLEHCLISGTTGVGTGTAIAVESDADTLTAPIYNHVDDVEIDGYEYGIKLSSSNAFPTFGNRFNRLVLNQIMHAIYETKGVQSIHANHYDYTYQAFNNPALDIDCLHIEGDYNIIIGATYDFNPPGGVSPINFTASAGANWANFHGTEHGTPIPYIDAGGLNRIWLADGFLKTNRLNSSIIFPAVAPTLPLGTFTIAYNGGGADHAFLYIRTAGGVTRSLDLGIPA